MHEDSLRWGGGSWWNVGTGYLALRFFIGSDVYYGWAQISISNNPGMSLTIIDYVFNAVLNQFILAGQTSFPRGGLRNETRTERKSTVSSSKDHESAGENQCIIVDSGKQN